MNILIVHYSLFGHTHYLAEAVEKGVCEIENVVAEMRRVPESLSLMEIERKGASEFQKSFMTIPLCTVDDMRNSMPFSSGHQRTWGIFARKCSNF